MESEFQKKEYKIHESVIQLQEMIDLLGYDMALQEQLQECKTLIEEKRYRIAIMGEFKRGKSSLINALLGAKILPANATPTTATINRITYGSTPRVVITYKNNSKLDEIKIDELDNYVTKQTSAGSTRALTIKEATIYYPTVICQNHVDMIDTPGLNDEESMTNITLDMIRSVDAVIIPLHARAPFSETEMHFVCQLLGRENIDHIIFVVTFLDQLEEEDYEYNSFIDYIKHRIYEEVIRELDSRKAEEKIKQKAKRLLSDASVHGVSSTLALKAFLSNNQALLKASRFEEFSTALLQTITANQLTNSFAQVNLRMRMITEMMPKEHEKRLHKITNQTETMKKTMDWIKDYQLQAKQKMSVCFAKYYDVMETCSKQVYSMKNDMAKVFMKGLGRIRVNEEEEILAILHECKNIAIETVSKPCESKMKQALIELLVKQSEEATSEVTCILEEIHSLHKDVMNENWNSAFIEDAKQIIKPVTFRWKTELIPYYVSIREDDLMDGILTAIDEDVNDLYQAIQMALQCVRKTWFQKLENIQKRLENEKQNLEKLLVQQEQERKVYLQNYRVLYERALKIVKGLDQ